MQKFIPNSRETSAELNGTTSQKTTCYKELSTSALLLYTEHIQGELEGDIEDTGYDEECHNLYSCDKL